MRILFGVYPWAFDCPGGGERQLLAYKEHLTDMGIQVDLYDLWNPRIKEYDIFHFFSVMPGSFQLCNHIKQQGLKLVISPNLWVTEETKYNYPHNEIKQLLDIADKIVVNSIMEVESLSSVYDIDYDIFSVIYNGVEDEYFNSNSGKKFEEKYDLLNTKYILNVANIENRKNQLNFLKALKSFPELKLVTIGHARDEKYAAECASIGGDQFIFIGDLPYGSDILHSAYKGCEFFVMPSTLETPSIAALEAAASGAKILITSIGSTQEYFKNHAHYIDPFDLESIKNALIAIMQSEQNKILKNHISKLYRWSIITHELEKLYINTLCSNEQ